MQVVIVAGGEGKRMHPLTVHKSLIPLLGQQLVTYLMNELAAQGNQFIIVTGPDSVKNFEEACIKWNPRVVVQSQPNGMADAIRSTSDYIVSSEPLLIVSAAKLLSPMAYQTVMKMIKKDTKQAFLSAYKTEIYKEGGYLKLADGKVTDVIEKPGADNLPSPFYKLVLDYFPVAGDLIDSLSPIKTDNDDEYEMGVSHYAKSHPTKVCIVDSEHVSLKYAHHVLDAMRLAFRLRLKKGIHPAAKIAKNCVIEGDVQIDEGARIYDYAVIKGPAYIGRNAVIGNGALVRESSIEENCQVGYGSEIARSYLGPGTKGHMMYVGDSIIEGSVNLSAGTVCANYRFDHKEVVASMPVGKVETGKKKFGAIIAKNTITGVNTSLMPGTVVGKGVTIGSGCVVRGLIPDGTIIQPVFSIGDKKK
jgi:bifunctional UDP-N-acetylglucosamine pyrophosphorylase/glucosamine-1-phosphate N-acetyltransferase